MNAANDINKLLLKVKNIHFIGIGGASVSSLALFLNKKGFRISGSDNNDITHLFKNQENITLFKGHSAKNVKDAEMVVYTRAVGEENPELLEAKRLGIPVFERAELLGAISDRFGNSLAVSGSHGKTTTTSMAGTVFLDLGLDPTVMVGGRMRKTDSNFVSGQSDYFVYEACEYCNSFWNFRPRTAIILNIDLDHPDFFKSLEQLYSSFEVFTGNIHPGGYAVVNADDPGVSLMLEQNRIKADNIITFGLGENADFSAADIVNAADGGTRFTLNVRYGGSTETFGVSLAVSGTHNVLNALAVIAASYSFGLDTEKVLASLSQFQSPKRRNELVFKSGDLTVIDDFSHHPTELAAIIKTARNGGYDRVAVIFQPHTYTRTKAFLKEFAESLSLADRAIILPVYPAREKDIYGISSRDLADLIPGSVYAGNFEEAAKAAMSEIQGKTAILTLGAGDVYRVWDYLRDMVDVKIPAAK